MTKDQQDRAWASLPEDFKKEAKKLWELDELPLHPDYDTDSVAEGVAYVLTELFGTHNLTAGEQPKPRFKIGDKVRIIAECSWKNAIGTIISIDSSGDEQKLRLSGCGIDTYLWAGEVEPYTAPEAKEETVKEAKESEETFAFDLNLCSLLKGCEGMEFWSPLCGKCKIHRLGTMVLDIESEGGGRISLRTDGSFFKGGELMLFPSKDCRSWEGWQPPKKRWKPKKGEGFYFITPHGDIGGHSWGDTYVENLLPNFGNCFRTHPQAAEAAKRVRETLEKYHEELGE